VAPEVQAGLFPDLEEISKAWPAKTPVFQCGWCGSVLAVPRAIAGAPPLELPDCCPVCMTLGGDCEPAWQPIKSDG
jgi:hypothetical protein